jgi:phospholipase/lecithinase/hemolysin
MFFYGGPNDFIFNNTLTPPVIIASLLKGVEAVLAVGAQNIIIFNIPPVQYYPYNNPTLFAELTYYANLALTGYLQPIQAAYPTASLNIFNLNSFVTKLVNKTTSYFTDVTDNCWNLYNATTVQILCPNPEKYVFLDTFHLTTRAQGLLAAAFRPFLDYSYENNNANCYVQAA